MKLLEGVTVSKPADIQQLVLNELKKTVKERQLMRLSRLSKMSYRYLLAVAHGDIADPSFRKLTHLASFLGIRVTHEICPNLIVPATPSLRGKAR